MRTIFSFVAVVLISTLSGCSKSDTPKAASPTGSPYVMTANIGGASFSRDSCVYFYPTAFDSTEIEILGWNGNVPATVTNYPQIYLYLSGSYHGTGTYAFSNPGQNMGQLLTSATAGDYAVSGTVTITATSPNLVGTFSFTTVSGTVVSGGSFTAQLQ